MDEISISRLEQLMEDTLEVAEENNKILHSIQRTTRWAFWGKLILWIIVLALPVLFLGPLLHTILPISNVSGTGASTFGLPSADQFKAIIQAYTASSSSAQ